MLKFKDLVGRKKIYNKKKIIDINKTIGAQNYTNIYSYTKPEVSLPLISHLDGAISRCIMY